jgi:hypothetical protein
MKDNYVQYPIHPSFTGICRRCGKPKDVKDFRLECLSIPYLKENPERITYRKLLSVCKECIRERTIREDKDYPYNPYHNGVCVICKEKQPLENFPRTGYEYEPDGDTRLWIKLKHICKACYFEINQDAKRRWPESTARERKLRYIPRLEMEYYSKARKSG